MPQLLIVEDQPSLLDSVRRGFESEGFHVLTAGTGKDAISICESAEIDVVILDLMLPDGDGLEILATLRRNGFHKPILIVSARHTVDQRVSGLNVGADDYLVKPFVFSELLARIRALLRRKVPAAESVLRFDNLILDLVTRSVLRDGEPVTLTSRQFEVLAYLISNQGEVVSREMLARDIWREETATWTNLIQVQINRLRSKLDTPNRKLRLHTIRGEGYLLGDVPK